MICEKLLDYNLVDVEGLVLLNEVWGLVEDQFEQAELVVGPPEDGIYTSKLHDHDVIKEFRNTMVFDTKYQEWRRTPLDGKTNVGDKFILSQDFGDGKFVQDLTEIGKKGGYVPPPLRAGIFEGVAVFDFNKQYPNAIMSSNAGARTAINLDGENWFSVIDKNGTVWDRKDIIETPVAFFRKDILSINRHKFEKWLKFRKIAQKRAKDYLETSADQDDPFYKILDGKQFRIKIFTNGGFGIMGYRKDRNYSQLVFNNATLMCQDLTKKMILFIRDLGYDIVGGDTDSCFVQLKSTELIDWIVESHWISNVINIEIDKYLNEVYNIQEHTMTVSVESISDKFIVKAMKNYIKRNVWRDGVILSKPQLEVKGISMKKRSTSRFSADMQETLIDILLNSQEIEGDFDLLMNILDKNFHKLPWDYVAPKGALNNDMDEYKEGHYNSRGAKNARRYFNKNLLPGDNPFIIPFKQYPKKINNQFVSPYKIGNILALSFDIEDVDKVKKAGFVPDWEDLKRSQLKLKSDPFLSFLGTDFYKSKAKHKVSDDMQL